LKWLGGGRVGLGLGTYPAAVRGLMRRGRSPGVEIYPAAQDFG